MTEVENPKVNAQLELEHLKHFEKIKAEYQKLAPKRNNLQELFWSLVSLGIMFYLVDYFKLSSDVQIIWMIIWVLSFSIRQAVYYESQRIHKRIDLLEKMINHRYQKKQN
ncbi:MAG: hypothetical protein COW84_06240 [Gammaproteobacteria bacterium CG22_combo_CG10-13_8_21_14_all_40_8]|nr:MAG: hypothetical protein COW84_06240 [Gammaproteobacteria bacterium CG22_combo_CG10-13_8_21_14_all_40_8]